MLFNSLRVIRLIHVCYRLTVIIMATRTATGIIKSAFERMPALSRPQLLKNESFIGGEWVSSRHDKSFPVLNPANEEVITEVDFRRLGSSVV